MSGVDKARLRAAFSRRAPAYEAGARLQRDVADRLARLVRETAPRARRILDVGCGTGALLAALGAGRPGDGRGDPARDGGPPVAVGVDLAHGMVRLARVALPRAGLAAGDAEALPFRAAAFDLVVSSSTFQWLPDLDGALAEVRRVLRPGGALGLALFCGETLRELRESWRAALPPGVAPSTHGFHPPGAVRDALARAGLPAGRFEIERRVVRHASVLELLESLRGIGAGNAVAGRSGGLGLRRAVRDMSRIYEARHGGADGVPATWDVAYALARRA